MLILKPLLPLVLLALVDHVYTSKPSSGKVKPSSGLPSEYVSLQPRVSQKLVSGAPEKPLGSLDGGGRVASGTKTDDFNVTEPTSSLQQPSSSASSSSSSSAPSYSSSSSTSSTYSSSSGSKLIGTSFSLKPHQGLTKSPLDSSFDGSIAPHTELIVYIATKKEHLDVYINAQREIEECTGLAVPFEQGATVNELLRNTPKDMFLVKTRIVGDYLVFADTIDMEVDGNESIHDYFVGISPVVLAVPKVNEHFKALYFFPVRHFASGHLSLKSVDSYYPPIIAADMHEKYAKEDHVAYVLVSSPKKRIVPLDEAFKFDRGQMIITVPKTEIEDFEEWANEMNLLKKEDLKDRELSVPSIGPGKAKEWTLDQLLNPGQAEKHYKLGEYIGEGLFGKVYQGLAVCGKRQAIVAIKLLQLNEEDRRIKMAIQELRALKRVKHRDVVEMQSARLTADGRTLYLSMKYVPGSCLYQWTKARADKLRKSALTQDGLETTMTLEILPLSKVKFAAKRLFSALRAIHSAGIAHGDLDTSNIRIDNPEGPGCLQITIIDLNGAKLDGDDVARAMEDDIIRLTMVILELGMRPQPTDMPRLLLNNLTSEHFGGALISIPRWVNDVPIARHVFKMSQNRTDATIFAYPEVLNFVGHVLKLDEERQLTMDNVFQHSLLKKYVSTEGEQA